MVQLNLHASDMNNAELRLWIETRVAGCVHGRITIQGFEQNADK
jgi:hypothetical protein